MTSAVLSKNINANATVQLAHVARRTFVTRGVITTTYVAVSCEKNIAEPTSALQSRRTTGPRLTRPAVTGFLVGDVTRVIIQFVSEILQACSGESHWDRCIMAVHQFVIRRSEVQVLLGPRGSNIVAGTSVMITYSIFVFFLICDIHAVSSELERFC